MYLKNGNGNCTNEYQNRERKSSEPCHPLSLRRTVAATSTHFSSPGNSRLQEEKTNSVANGHTSGNEHLSRFPIQLLFALPTWPTEKQRIRERVLLLGTDRLCLCVSVGGQMKRRQGQCVRKKQSGLDLKKKKKKSCWGSILSRLALTVSHENPDSATRPARSPDSQIS